MKINAKPKAVPSVAEGIGDAVTVRGKLALLGWASVAAWARAHGYDAQIVRWTITHWGNRTDRRPHGGLTRHAMRDLRDTLSTGKTPAMHAATKAQAVAQPTAQSVE